MLSREEAQKIAQKVIALSSYPECQVNISDSEQVYTRFANNGITTAAFSRRHTVNCTVTRDGKTGSYAVNDLDDANLKALVKKAEELAAIAPPNAERLPALGPQNFPKVFDFDERTATARSPEMIPHVKTVVDAALKQKLVAAGLILRTHTVNAVANKNGLFGFHNAADSQLTTTIRMADGSSSGWAGQPSTKLSEIDSARQNHLGGQGRHRQSCL
jgi:predicted Zn-dependent protease